MIDMLCYLVGILSKVCVTIGIFLIVIGWYAFLYSIRYRQMEEDD